MQIDQAYEVFLMKMEVLSVQNHIQGQFGVIGSTKVKDWSSPLTPPPPPPPPLPPTQAPHTNQPPQHSNVGALAQQAPLATAPTARARSRSRSRSTTPVPVQPLATSYNNKLYGRQQSNVSDDGASADVVDGRLSATPKAKFMLPPQQSQQQQRAAHAQPPLAHYYYHNHQNFATAVAAATAQPPNGQAKINLSSLPCAEDTGGTVSAYSYNNNILYCADTTMGMAALEASPASMAQTPTSTSDMFIDTNAINELSQRLQAELRTAKSRHLACTEVSIPWDLTPRIAAEIIRVSEREPCGIRGCTIFIEFEDEPNNIRRIASFKMDPNTVSTFELYLTLKQDKSGWTSLLPQFLKNLTRSSTIMISPDFTLTKNKLYSGE